MGVALFEHKQNKSYHNNLEQRVLSESLTKSEREINKSCSTWVDTSTLYPHMSIGGEIEQIITETHTATHMLNLHMHKTLLKSAQTHTATQNTHQQ